MDQKEIGDEKIAGMVDGYLLEIEKLDAEMASIATDEDEWAVGDLNECDRGSAAEKLYRETRDYCIEHMDKSSVKEEVELIKSKVQVLFLDPEQDESCAIPSCFVKSTVFPGLWTKIMAWSEEGTKEFEVDYGPIDPRARDLSLLVSTLRFDVKIPDNNPEEAYNELELILNAPESNNIAGKSLDAETRHRLDSLGFAKLPWEE